MIACRGQSLGVFSGFGHGPDHKCAPRLAQETIMCMSPAIPPPPPAHPQIPSLCSAACPQTKENTPSSAQRGVWRRLGDAERHAPCHLDRVLVISEVRYIEMLKIKEQNPQ